jgi:hypothetical protein
VIYRRDLYYRFAKLPNDEWEGSAEIHDEEEAKEPSSWVESLTWRMMTKKQRLILRADGLCGENFGRTVLNSFALTLGLLLLSYLFEQFNFKGSSSFSGFLFLLSYIMSVITICSSGLASSRIGNAIEHEDGISSSLFSLLPISYPTLEGIWLKEGLLKMPLLAVTFAWLPAISFISHDVTFSSLIGAYLWFLPMVLLGTTCVMAIMFLYSVYQEDLPKQGKGSKRMLVVKLLMLAFIIGLIPTIPIMISIFSERSFDLAPLFLLCCLILAFNLLLQRALIRWVIRDPRCDFGA